MNWTSVLLNAIQLLLLLICTSALNSLDGKHYTISLFLLVYTALTSGFLTIDSLIKIRINSLQPPIAQDFDITPKHIFLVPQLSLNQHVHTCFLNTDSLISSPLLEDFGFHSHYPQMYTFDMMHFKFIFFILFKVCYRWKANTLYSTFNKKLLHSLIQWYSGVANVNVRGCLGKERSCPPRHQLKKIGLESRHS